MAFEGGVQDFPESQMSREQLLSRARQLAWYHTLTLDTSLRTEGFFDLEPYVGYYLPVATLDGMECFEAGSGNGFWAFEMERMQARAVTTLDLPDFFNTDFSVWFGKDSGRPAGPALPGAFGEPLRIAATLKGSGLKYVLGTVYDLSPTTHGMFDVVFSGSMLMHLFGPMLALQRMASICRNVFLLTTQTDPALEPLNVMSYLGHQIPYVHFVPSPTCLESMITSCGFERVLRGPTFQLALRDKANPTIPHTTFVGLKSDPRAVLNFGPTASMPDAGRLSVLAAPGQVAPREAFQITVEVRNLGARTWLAENREHRLTVLAECDGTPNVRCDVADYVPVGLASVAVLKCTAPAREERVRIGLSLWCGPTKIDTITAEASVTVREPSALRDVVAGVRRTIWRK